MSFHFSPLVYSTAKVNSNLTSNQRTFKASSYSPGIKAGTLIINLTLNIQLTLNLIECSGFVQHPMTYDCLWLLTLAVNGHLEEEK